MTLIQLLSGYIVWILACLFGLIYIVRKSRNDDDFDGMA